MESEETPRKRRTKSQSKQEDKPNNGSGSRKRLPVPAHLIKHREPEAEEYTWFWINANTGTMISPQFSTQAEAEDWMEDAVTIHREAMNLIERAKNGRFYMLKARINLYEQNIGTIKSCPFDFLLNENQIVANILGITEKDARDRLSKYFVVEEWI